MAKITKKTLADWLRALDVDVAAVFGALDKASTRMVGLNMYLNSLEARIEDLEAKAQANAPAKEADHG